MTACFRRKTCPGERHLHDLFLGQRITPAIRPYAEMNPLVSEIVNAESGNSLEAEQASDGMAVMAVEDGPRLFVDKERFGVATPPFCHLEQLVSISLFDLFMRLQPSHGNEDDIVFAPRH